MTVLGASGFIGSRLSTELRRRRWPVSMPPREEDLAGLDLGTVFYCIGLTGDASLRPLETIEAHVVKLVEVLRACRFDRLVYLSSTRLYLGASGGGETDTLCIDPRDAGRLFNLSKAAGEALVLDSGRPASIARLSNVYGADWESQNFLPMVIGDACRDGRIVVRDALESAKDYVHVQDAIDALIHIGLDGTHEVYNVASGRNVTHGEIARELQKLTGCTLGIGPSPRTVVFPAIETSRLQAEHPFTPRPVLADLPQLVDECRAWLTRSEARAAE